MSILSDLSAVSSPDVRVRFSPYERVEIESSGLRLVKRRDAPATWLATAPGEDGESGPLTWDQALGWSELHLGSGPQLDRIAAIGKFEESRKFLLEHWAARAVRPRAEGSGLIAGITLSPGNYCSMGCAYCYAKPRFTDEPGDQTTDETLQNVFSFIRDDPRVRPGCAITIGGGGDGLENFGFYRRAVELARESEREHGTKTPIYLATVDPQRLLADPGMLDLIVENQQWVTLSIDGDAHLPYHRPRVDVRPLLEAYRTRCHWAASAVFTARTAQHIRHNYLYLLDCGFEAIQMIPARLAKSHLLHLEPEHFTEAVAQYRSLLDQLVGEGRLVELFSRITTGDALGRFLFRYLTEKEAGLRCGAGTQTVFADPLGKLYPCPSSSHPSTQLGDVTTGVTRLPVLDEIRSKPAECLSCRILKACGGPCTHESVLLHEAPGQVTPAVCDFQRGLCDVVVELIDRLYNEDPGLLSTLFETFALKAGGVPVEEAVA